MNFELPYQVRIAARLLIKDRRFSLPIILTFALGIGVSSAAFGLVSALMFRPLPISAPGRLVQLVARNSRPGALSPFPWSYPNFVDYTHASPSVFSSVCATSSVSLNLERAGRVEKVRAAEVAGDFFGTMGVTPMLGRPLSMDDHSQPSTDYSVVATRSFWQENLASSPIGSSLTLNHHLFTLIGIVDNPVLFQALRDPQLFVPVGTMAAVGLARPLSSRNVAWATVFARLAPEVSLRQAQAAVDVVQGRLARLYPKDDGGLTVRASPASTISELLDPRQRSPVLAAELLWVLTSLLLIAACANCASLSLTRGVRRLHEFAIRSALGASSMRLIGELLVESFLICGVGSGLGCGLGIAGLTLLGTLPDFARFSPTFDGRVLIYAVALTAFATVLFGWTPLTAALGQSWRNLQVRGTAPSHVQQGFRRFLGASQVAFSIVLLVSAGVILHSLLNLTRTKLGLDVRHLLVADVNFSNLTGSPGRMPSETALERLRSEIVLVPGVKDVTFATATPLQGVRMMASAEVQGYVPSPDEDTNVRFVTVADNYFRALHLPIIRGRGFEKLPRGQNDWVVISSAVAGRYWRGLNPVGQQITLDGHTFRVAGVVRDIREDGPSAEPVPLIYYRYPTASSAFVGLLVRTAASIQAVTTEGGILRALRRAVPEVPQPTIAPMSQRLETMLVPQRKIGGALGGLAALAVLLASLGLFSILCYDVAARNREFAIRAVFGARQGELFRIVLRRGLEVSAWGMIVGVMLSIGVVRILRHFVFGVSLLDPASFAAALVCFLLVAIVASTTPARRAARVDPAIALREE